MCRANVFSLSKGGEVADSLFPELRPKLVEPEIPASAASCIVSDLDQLISEGKKFRTIYADPPWMYGNRGPRASADNHYRTMSADTIAALPVGKHAADNCHLHLWSTYDFLFQCLRIIEAWGFQYKTCFAWVKPEPVKELGNYWRVATELLLLGVRGSYKHVIEASPAPRLELFAQTNREPEIFGWGVGGKR
jgi:N6-adenosine-specific RNA methylase IME4